jgi:hypothetical protein
MRIIFVSLAANQTGFFCALSRTLQGLGHACELILFHERSMDLAKAAGIKAHNAFASMPRPASVALEAAELHLRERVGARLPMLLSHERESFEVDDTAKLKRKLSRYLRGLDALLDRLAAEAGAPLVVVQELGGFASNLAVFHAARARGIPHYFLEPSIFRGRFFAVRDGFGAPVIPAAGRAATDALRRYIEETISDHRILIPLKDKGHYRAAWAKVLDRRNLLRLGQKLRDSYLLGMEEEFSHPLQHARRHAMMVLRSRAMARLYSALPADRPFVYFPLHVPWDVALTLRTPEHLDQMALLDYVARALPTTHVLCIKEHPALVGASVVSEVRRLLRRQDNVRLVPASLNGFDITRRAAAVLTINSKAGAEALMLGKPVVCFGDAFYRHTAGVHAVEDLRQLPAVLDAAIVSPAPDREKMLDFFQAAWDRSGPGELYQESPENLGQFAESLLGQMERRGE